jgi:AraC family ethanolamine operon transcriptional activator
LAFPSTPRRSTPLGVSARTLHEGFRAVFGMSVQRYLRMRRLSLARSALRRGELVKRAALANGFWHLGRFAGDYRAVFGELPSETLASTLASRITAR